MAILDEANNALLLIDADGQFASTDTGADVISSGIDLYRAIDLSIRHRDEAHQLLLKRLIAGFQAMHNRLQTSLESLTALWTLDDCPTDLLPIMKFGLGWGPEYDWAFSQLSPIGQRRLLAASISLWKLRGSEEPIVPLINVLFGVQARIWNWFDLRWILDEGGLTEEHSGYDPHVLSLPGPPDDDEYRSSLRIMDDGTGQVNRSLVEVFVEAFRPINETIEVVWLLFLDLFTRTLSAFNSTGDAAGIVDQTLVLTDDTDDEFAWANSIAASQTSGHLGFIRVRGMGKFGATFWLDDNGDGYVATLDIAANELRLETVIAGAYTTIEAFDFDDAPEILENNKWYGLRWLAQPGATDRIRLYVDNVLRIEWAGSALHNVGTFGAYHQTGGSVTISEIDIMPDPGEVSEITP